MPNTHTNNTTETNLSIVPVILCGGSGTRLWPLSRETYPKQFLELNGESTLFQQAFERSQMLAKEDITIDKTLVVTNEAHRFLCLDQLAQLNAKNGKQTPAEIILEPSGKNTAPAMTLAALEAASLQDFSDFDPILVVTAADQTIQDTPAFVESMQNCIRVAATGGITIMGITADRPETGYGYIKHGRDAGNHNEYKVEKFTEKPDIDAATQYIASGEYAWNSGIFVVRASVWLATLEATQPDIYNTVKDAWQKRVQDNEFIRPDADLFSQCRSESVDYAVLEPCTDATLNSPPPINMVPLDAGWSDLGVWDAVWDVSSKDSHNNALHGDTVISNTTNSLIHSSSRLISVVGLDNLIVIETPDAVLIADKNNSQAVKQIVNQLNARQREETQLHRKVHRPWGWYDSIDESDRFKVKRIQVKPGASLSLQKHHHRAEHWIVVSGTAEVTCGDEVTLLSENESTYIPLGVKHRLANPGAIPLEIIEVQSGSYLGEDDIVRYEDTYGRT